MRKGVIYKRMNRMNNRKMWGFLLENSIKKEAPLLSFLVLTF